MPFVNIQVTREGVTKEQKKKIIGGVTKLLFDVLKKAPELTHIVIEEVGTDNWGFAGEQVTDIRKKSPKK